MLTCVSLIGTTVVPYNMFIHATSARKTWHDPKSSLWPGLTRPSPWIIGGIITGAVYDYGRYGYAGNGGQLCHRHGGPAGAHSG